MSPGALGGWGAAGADGTMAPLPAVAGLVGSGVRVACCVVVGVGNGASVVVGVGVGVAVVRVGVAVAVRRGAVVVAARWRVWVVRSGAASVVGVIDPAGPPARERRRKHLHGGRVMRAAK